MSTFLSHAPSETYDPIEAGNHVARCISIIDLGTQTEKKFESEEEVQNQKIRITWELPHETYEHENKDTGEKTTRCKTIGKEFKASLHEKASLRKMLADWRGRDFTSEELAGFELANILDKPCMLNILHTEKGDKKYANISAITPLAKGMNCPDRVNELTHYNIEDGKNDTYDKLPKFIQERISESAEFATLNEKSKTLHEPTTQVVPDVNIDEINLQMPF